MLKVEMISFYFRKLVQSNFEMLALCFWYHIYPIFLWLWCEFRICLEWRI